MGFGEQVEFYATCHPPLCPKGVKEVTTSAVNQLGDRLHEILYEPELPAFRLVSALNDRDAVLLEIQSILAGVLDRDFNTFKGSSSSSTSEENLLEFEDSSRRLIPWLEHNTRDAATLAQFDDHRFPSPLHRLPDKAIWRGLEAYDDWKFSKLIHHVKSFWKGRAVPVDICDFEAHYGCKFRVNMAETVVYVGVNQPRGSIRAQEITSALERLVNFFTTDHARVKHLVMSDCQKRAQFVFQSFTYLGFDSTTYLPPNAVENYPQMLKATSVRNMPAEWERPRRLPEPTLEKREKPSVNSTFEIFDDHKPYLGSAKGVAIIKDTCDDALHDLAPEEQTYNDETTWSWLLDDTRACTKQVGIGCTDFNWVPQSAYEVVEPKHLLDSDPPDLLLMANFIPLQYPLPPSLTSDCTSTKSPQSPTAPDFEDPDSAFECSDLIQFDDSDDECSFVEKKAIQMPTDIQELGTAFGKLKLEANPTSGLLEGLATNRTGEIQAPEPSFWTIAKPAFRYLFRALQLTPGKVSLELCFGRIILYDLNSSDIVDGLRNRGHSRTAERTAQYLDNWLPDSARKLEFSGILSTCAGDATTISKIKPHGMDEWHNSNQGRRVFYDIICRPSDDASQIFIISIDAETLAYEVRAELNDLASVLIHCPESTWDLKVAAVHHSSPTEVQQWMAFSKLIVESLLVSSNTEHGICLELCSGPGTPAVVTEVRLRQVAEYSNKSFLGSIMLISLTKAMDLSRKSESSQGSGQQCLLRAIPRRAVHKTTEPSQWVEVAMHSHTARKMTSCNSNSWLGIENRAVWSDIEKLEAPGGVLDELCWPALGMIADMDGCGLLNDNGQTSRPSSASSLRDQNRETRRTVKPRAEATAAVAQKPRYEFW